MQIWTMETEANFDLPPQKVDFVYFYSVNVCGWVGGCVPMMMFVKSYLRVTEQYYIFY